jgi:hypothetical protein
LRAGARRAIVIANERGSNVSRKDERGATMTGRIRLFTTLGISTWALMGCRHSGGEGTAPASAPATRAKEDASLVEAGTASVDAAPPSPKTVPAETPDASSPDAGAPVAAAATAADMTSAPAYPPSALHDTFSQAEAKLIGCYLPGKKRDPKLRGKVIVKLTINADGRARPVANENSNLEDPEVIACVIRTVKTLRFMKPVEGSVTVIYPLIFRPTGDVTLILPDAGKP